MGAGQVTGSSDQGESDSQLYQPVFTVCTSSVLTGTGDHSTYKLMDEDQEKLTRDIKLQNAGKIKLGRNNLTNEKVREPSLEV